MAKIDFLWLKSCPGRLRSNVTTQPPRKTSQELICSARNGTRTPKPVSIENLCAWTVSSRNTLQLRIHINTAGSTLPSGLVRRAACSPPFFCHSSMMRSTSVFPYLWKYSPLTEERWLLACFVIRDIYLIPPKRTMSELLIAFPKSCQSLCRNWGAFADVCQTHEIAHRNLVE